MADNVDITPGSGKTIAADDVGGGVLHQLIKLTYGSDGAATMVDSNNGLPVLDENSADLLTAAQAIQTAVEILDNIVSGSEAQVDVVSVTIPSTLHNGQKTVTTAGTAEALAASQAISSGVTVKALAANTDTVYVGDSGVSSANGFELAAGEQVFLEIANLATVFVDAAVDGEGVSFVGS